MSHGGNSSELFSPAVSFFLPTLRPFSVLFATTPVEILIPILLTTKGRGIERGERGRDVWSEPSNLIHTLLAFLVQSKCCLLSESECVLEISLNTFIHFYF